MTDGLLNSAGGLGLFLLGMSLMTRGLRSLANERLRQILASSTKNVTSGVATGALTTALIQSSSATTVTAVGFVGAGLLTFPQALGIIFGANIGTTITGWLVALLGFKLQLGELALPLVFCGALLRLFTRGKSQEIGESLSGFALIFVGISLLQTGMSGMADTITPESFPPDTWTGRLLLIAIGLAVTIVTQSSSAGVATALTAVNTGTLSLNQAAAMVIGMDLGTTFTAVLATIGGNVSARRTGFAHVVYNAMTAVLALGLLPVYMGTISWISPATITGEPELVLVGFHTFFNGLGVLVILPFTSHFARLIEQLFPERGNPLTARLDRSLLRNPQAAMPSAMACLSDVIQALFGELTSRLKHAGMPQQADPNVIERAEKAVAELHAYMNDMTFQTEDNALVARYVAALHLLDHLERVIHRARQTSRMRHVREDEELTKLTEKTIELCQILATRPRSLHPDQLEAIREKNQQLKTGMRAYRQQVIGRTARKELSSSTAIERMDSARWLRRIGYHCWRIAYHLSELPKEGAPKTSSGDQSSP